MIATIIFIVFLYVFCYTEPYLDRLPEGGLVLWYTFNKERRWLFITHFA